jgi:Family of unknown function (DUF6159)
MIGYLYFEEKIVARKIANGVQLTQQCWRALRRNPQLIIFPLLSSIALVIVAASLIIPSLLAVTYLSHGQAFERDDIRLAVQIIAVAILFLFYFVCYTVIIFSNTALVGVSLKLLQGESATVCDGIGIAMKHLGQIIGFAVISATLGTLAKLSSSASKRDSENGIAGVLTMMMGAFQGVWSVVVFFAIPVYVVENLGAIASIRRSWDIFKQTWGESFTGKAVIGGVGCLVKFVLLAIIAALIAVTAATNYILLLGIAILFGIISFVVLALFNGAINGVFQASLYHYATTGDAGQFIDNDLARNAFPG